VRTRLPRAGSTGSALDRQSGEQPWTASIRVSDCDVRHFQERRLKGRQGNYCDECAVHRLLGITSWRMQRDNQVRSPRAGRSSSCRGNIAIVSRGCRGYLAGAGRAHAV
jgi:hypothetical protein